MRKGVIIASPDLAQRDRLNLLVGNMPEFTVLARTGDLMNTYNEVEARLPNAVLIADVLAELPEFEVMRALFSTLDIRWLVVTSPHRHGRFHAAPDRDQETASGLFSIPGDAPPTTYARQLSSLTQSSRHWHPPPAISSGTIGQAEPATRKHAEAQGVNSPSVASPNAASQRRVSRGGAVIGTSLAPSGKRPCSPARIGIDRSSVITPTNTDGLILIGASTGGVDALLNVLMRFPTDCPPTLVVQHTGSGFGQSLASLLNRQCLPEVRLATDPLSVKTGMVVIGAGIKSHLVLGKGADLTVRLQDGAPVAGHVPSVDMLFQSAVHFAPKVAAAILTGMGRDGADGMKALHDAGALTIAQDEASCVVFGMPRAAIENRSVRHVLPLDRIAEALLTNRRGRRSGGIMELHQ